MHLTLQLFLYVLFFPCVGWLEYLICQTVPYVHCVFQNTFKTEQDTLPAWLFQFSYKHKQLRSCWCREAVRRLRAPTALLRLCRTWECGALSGCQFSRDW